VNGFGDVVLTLDAKERPIDGLVVRRALPQAPRRMVGPFIFVDHMGPTRLAAGAGFDVRPHPHIGLATVTFLLEGALLHRDSLGIVQPILPGDVNWMTAGAGITHSERTPPDRRGDSGALHGLQCWVALPRADETMAPAFAHHAAADLPSFALGAGRLTLVAGRLAGHQSPVATRSQLVHALVRFPRAGTMILPPEHPERAVYVLGGRVRIGDTVLEAGRMAVLAAESEVPMTALGGTEALVFGGAPLEEPRYIDWNFVASDKALIESAKQRWRSGLFPAVPGDREFIPLP
jgi:hypothetical protein